MALVNQRGRVTKNFPCHFGATEPKDRKRQRQDQVIVSLDTIAIAVGSWACPMSMPTATARRRRAFKRALTMRGDDPPDPLPDPVLPRLPALACTLLAVACAGLACNGEASSATMGDAWGVRVLGTGAERSIESLSDINTGKPARVRPLPMQVVATRERAGATVQLLADAATANVLRAPGAAFGPELDKAVKWLQRLHPRGQPPARIVLTLVDGRHRLRRDRSHPVREGVVVDLVMALPATDGTSLSTAVGKALAVALHETSHAYAALLPAGKAPGRRDDEYRSSLVDSCYLVDTLRAGDTLQLAPRPAAEAGEYFVTAQSRDAARDVVAELVRAAGSGQVRGNDNVAMLGLDLACAVRLAQR
jgi:hypothetical protein